MIACKYGPNGLEPCSDHNGYRTVILPDSAGRVALWFHGLGPRPFSVRDCRVAGYDGKHVGELHRCFNHQEAIIVQSRIAKGETQ